jgi:hypothetical protein
VTLELAPWAKRVIERVENDRKFLDNKDSVEDFGWLHLPCGDAVVTWEYTVNSKKIDPASGDPNPIHMFKKHCDLHNVSSVGEEVGDINI